MNTTWSTSEQTFTAYASATYLATNGPALNKKNAPVASPAIEAIHKINRAKKQAAEHFLEEWHSKKNMPMYQPKFNPEGICIGAESSIEATNPYGRKTDAASLLTNHPNRAKFTKEWMDRVIHDAASWSDPLPITLNVRTSDFKEAMFEVWLKETSIRHRLDPSRLRLDIVEDTPWSDIPHLNERLGSLRNAGVKIALDDFGRQIANFDSAFTRPIDGINVGKNLLYQSIALSSVNRKDGSAINLLSSIVDHFKRQGLRVGITDVSNEKEYEYAKEAGVDVLQGKYLSPPLQNADFAPQFGGGKKHVFSGVDRRTYNIAANILNTTGYESQSIEPWFTISSDRRSMHQWLQDTRNATSIKPQTTQSYHHEKDNKHQRQQDLLKQFEHDLGLNNDQVQAFFQPKQHIRDGTCLGAEALLRWMDSNGKPYPLMELIDALNTSPLKYQVSKWMINKAVENVATWPDHMIVSVNVQADEIGQPEFLDDLKKILEKHNVPPQRLQLEILETQAWKAHPRAQINAIALRNFGIGIAIDDFGTSYSNFDSYHQKPVDCVKIDRSLLENAYKLYASDPSKNYLADIISTLHAQNIHVVVEGIENEYMEVFAMHAGADIAQGYYYDKPLPSSSFTRKYAQKTATPSLDLDQQLALG